jgi:hypothetical protein
MTFYGLCGQNLSAFPFTMAEIQEKGNQVHPFLNYEVAKGIVEEKRAAAERRRRWRRREDEVVPPSPSWDAEVIQLLVMESAGEQEKVGA